MGEYHIEEFIAIGGMSEVYRGRGLSPDNFVAIKIMHAELCLSDDLTVRFVNEARLLASIKRPHIIDMLAHGRLDSGVPFMVLEWLPCSLGSLLQDHPDGLPIPAVQHIAACVSHGLVSLHDEGIVHRDLKPDNILLSETVAERAVAKVADLSVAKLPGASGEASGPGDALPISTAGSALLGSWDYMSPEQWIRSKEATPASDVYSLGVLLFQMLTGRLPFVATEQSELMYLHLFNTPPWELLDGRVAASLRQLIMRMLDKEPAKRPVSRDVYAELAGHLH